MSSGTPSGISFRCFQSCRLRDVPDIILTAQAGSPKDCLSGGYILTRRDFGGLALAGLGRRALAQPAAGSNRSVVGGVQFGLQPFCYHDLPMNPENRPMLIRRLVQNGMGLAE